MTPADARAQRKRHHTSRSRCPQCGQTLPGIPDVHAAVCTPTPIKQYALEAAFGIKRMNGRFV